MKIKELGSRSLMCPRPPASTPENAMELTQCYYPDKSNTTYFVLLWLNRKERKELSLFVQVDPPLSTKIIFISPNIKRA